ncbi:MAG: ABC transporter ATP-binding protein [Lachnospiraceae bacterium]|nr:ABC transporter ATP-binding protein [Lachnospiraceae bacterium]
MMLIDIVKKNISIYKFLIKWEKQILLQFVLVAIKTVVIMISPLFVKMIIDVIQTKRSMREFIAYIIMLLLLSFATLLLKIFTSKTNIILKKDIYSKIQLSIIDKIWVYDGEMFMDNSSGNMMTLLMEDADKLTFFASLEWMEFFCELISGAFIILYFFIKSPIIALGGVLLLIITNVVQHKYDCKIKDDYKKQVDSNVIIVDFFQKILSNILLLKCSGGINYCKKEYSYKLDECINNEVKTVIDISINTGFIEMISSFMEILVWLIGGIAVYCNKIVISELIVYNSYFSLLLAPVLEVARMRGEIQDVFISANRIMSFLGEKPTDVFHEPILEPIYEIRMENISFFYEERMIFDDTNIVLNKGVNAIIAPSGSGKTTLVRLILGLWQADKGKVYINNSFYGQYTYEMVEKRMSVMTQECYLYDASIKDNLLLGADVELEIVREICNAVEIDDWIMEQPLAYDTVICGKGTDISGGQRQRLCLARTLIKKSDVIILDEPLSALDKETEAKIWRNINKYLEGKIVILISHRLELVDYINKKYYLKQGKIDVIE